MKMSTKVDTSLTSRLLHAIFLIGGQSPETGRLPLEEADTTSRRG
jgi:hypothetical protein